MNRKVLIQDLDAMDEVMERTAGRRVDIWQDRCIYAMAKAIWHILQWILRHGDRTDESKRVSETV